VPTEYPDADTIREITKAQGLTFGETRTSGQFIADAIVVGTETQTRKIPEKISLPLLATRHTAISKLKPEAVLKWGKIEGAGKPGQLCEGDKITIEVGFQSKFWIFQGTDAFIGTPSTDHSTTSMPALINRLGGFVPELARDLVSYDGLSEATSPLQAL
jgi:hypothetical protein